MTAEELEAWQVEDALMEYTHEAECRELPGAKRWVLLCTGEPLNAHQLLAPGAPPRAPSCPRCREVLVERVFRLAGVRR